MTDDSRIVSNQYAEYLKVNFMSGTKTVEDSIEETLIRLEEYSSLIDMVRSDLSVGICGSLLRNKEPLERLFENVRNLEAMVHRIKQDVDKVEDLVCNAEADLGISTEGKIKNLLKPFFKRSNSIPTTSRKKQVTFPAPELFKTKDFFPHED